MPISALQQRHEHALNAGQADILANVIQIQPFKLRHLRILLRIGAHHSHARKILLHAAADIGEHLLDVFETSMNTAAEEDHSDGNKRRGQQRDQSEPQHRCAA